MTKKKSDPNQIPENPEDIMENITEMTAGFHKMAHDFLQEQNDRTSNITTDPMHIGETLLELSRYYSSHPEQLVEKQMALWQNYMSLWQNTTRKMMGDNSVKPVITPPVNDKRFKGKEWENQIFDFIRQSYLLTCQSFTGAVDDIPAEDRHEKDKMNFFAKQFTDAMSPTNFALTNPEVIRETIDSQGQNLVKGFENILRDYNPENGIFTVKMTDEQEFELGRNIAMTAGKVIFRNELFELIHYTPTTKKQFKRPLLIIPPWINKFYILDLRQENSLVKWLTDNGHSVFIVSWRNPDKSMAALDFGDYMRLGTLTAIDMVRKATGEATINIAGYCIGGTLLAATLAHLAAKKTLDQIGCATFLVTQVDFSEAGELTIFVDDKQMADLEQTMEEKGFLDGKSMSNTFNMLRSNDLIWSFVINNYLKGKDPFPFDLLYWNGDNTRLTRACHSQYLHEMYLHNNLVKPGKIILNDTPLDLTKIDIPTYIQAARSDHICPWKSVYKATRHFSGPKRFMLAGSGHIAGVVNPPAAHKYNHWLNDDLPADPVEWLQGATSKDGSWWDDWHDWLKAKSGPKVAARHPGDGPLDIIEDAPGRYIRVRYG
ncbi:MAG: class I poly(R)-hydroxyalkanoic acid synthase [Alphaproteobacteria bacterium]|nr:class I poly(R)-hydroxyalkanoic acid synthase [Alphaproteobacteria bacterium]